MDKYRITGKVHLPIMSSRGCPFQCSFCVASQMFGAPFRARSAKNVVDEIIWLRDEYGAQAISFHDDTLTLDKKRIVEICDEMINRKAVIPWGCQTRVDTVSKEILAKMKKAGCNEVSFGVESGCQSILDAVHKKVNISQAEKAIKWAKEEGLFVAVSTIIGYPGETKESMQQTADLMRRIEPDDAWICIATPYPGTELRALVEKNGWKMTNEWTKYNTMNAIFDNPTVDSEEYAKMRKQFYNSLYTKICTTPTFKGYLHGNFYNKVMARTVNYMLCALCLEVKTNLNYSFNCINFFIFIIKGIPINGRKPSIDRLCSTDIVGQTVRASPKFGNRIHKSNSKSKYRPNAVIVAPTLRKLTTESAPMEF